MQEQILKIMKNRLNNVLFHIDVNTKYEGEMKVLEQVSSSLNNLLIDLNLVGTYHGQINNVLWHIKTNCRVLGAKEVLNDVRQSLVKMTK